MGSAAPSLFAPIEEDLVRVEERIQAAGEVEASVLREILQRNVLTAGKRIRPALTVASCRLFRDANESLYAMAAAVEFLHTATLLHDDVVDQTEMRRGSPSLYTIFGNSVAILVGDYLFAKAAATASETNNLRIMRLFAESVMTLCTGQIDEAAHHDEAHCITDRDRYYRTIDAKTAALFVFACHAGGIIGEASSEAAEALRRYGRSLGLAFQIVDDILDLTGDEATMGKPAGSDLRQGVVTLPVIYLRDEVPEKLFTQAFSQDGARDEAIHALTEHAKGSRAVQRSYAEAQALANEAVEALTILPHNEERDFLIDLTRTVVERDS